MDREMQRYIPYIRADSFLCNFKEKRRGSFYAHSSFLMNTEREKKKKKRIPRGKIGRDYLPRSRFEPNVGGSANG